MDKCPFSLILFEMTEDGLELDLIGRDNYTFDNSGVNSVYQLLFISSDHWIIGLVITTSTWMVIATSLMSIAGNKALLETFPNILLQYNTIVIQKHFFLTFYPTVTI